MTRPIWSTMSITGAHGPSERVVRPWSGDLPDDLPGSLRRGVLVRPPILLFFHDAVHWLRSLRTLG